ncbi:hypothetical protein ScPMuIL_015661, partial [Solemya velum]
AIYGHETVEGGVLLYMTKMQRYKRLKMTEVNSHLTCVLCGGYLIDATTIVECLHSFCKTCIVRYLESSKFCPICDVMVHKKRPLQRIRSDPTLQDIVYKIVPGLFKEEMKRRREFYEKNQTEETSKIQDPATEGPRIIISPDEKISLSLELCPYGVPLEDESDGLDDNSKLRDRRNLLCPASMTVAHLKKFLRLKYSLPSRYQVDVCHGKETLCDNYTVMDIAYISWWKRKEVMKLYYSIYENPAKRMRLEIPVPLKTHAKILASTPRVTQHESIPQSLQIDDDLTTTKSTARSSQCSSSSTPISRSPLGQCSSSSTPTSRSHPGQCSTSFTPTSRSHPGQCPKQTTCASLSDHCEASSSKHSQVEPSRTERDSTSPTHTPQTEQCCITFTSQASRPLHNPPSQNVTSKPSPTVTTGQCFESLKSPHKDDGCDIAMSSETQTQCEGYGVKNSGCSPVPVLSQKMDGADEECSMVTANAATNTDRAIAATEIDLDEAVVYDINHSVSSDNVSVTENETVKENLTPDHATCSNNSPDCTILPNDQPETVKLTSPELQKSAENVVLSDETSEAETEDYENIGIKKINKKNIEDTESSNVDENRNQKLQNDAHTQTDSDTLPESRVVSQPNTVLRETKCTETAQTQTSFLPNSQITQTVSVSQQTTSSPERKLDCTHNKYRQSNSEETNAQSPDTDDTLKVVVEEIPSPNLPIALENRVKYMEQSECHFSPTVNGFYKDSSDKITANVKQEVIDCGTETS